MTDSIDIHQTRYEVASGPEKGPNPQPIRSTPPRRSGDVLLSAARIEAETAAKPGDLLNPMMRRQATAIAERVRTDVPEYLAEVGSGGELVPNSVLGMNRYNAELHNTVSNPDYVTVDASRDRLELLQQAGAAEMGLDLADTIQAQNSMERMLAHQMAAAHRASLKMMAQVNRRIDSMEAIVPDRLTMNDIARLNVETCRLAGTAMRMMATFQQGAATIQRLRTGGTQQVTVQHQYVTKVEEGGQAVVGNINPKRTKRKRDA